MKSQFVKILAAIFFLLPICLPGCVSKEVKETTDKPVFFPPAPDLPRFQFLTSFSSTDDFETQVSGLDSFLGSAPQGYRLKKPYGVAMNKKAMYVVDTQTTVWKFDFVKRKIKPLAGDKGLGKLVQPINVFVDEKSNKYVADSVRGAVVKYDKNDFYVKSYTLKEPWKPVSAVIYEDMLFVVDSTHKTGGVKVFDPKSGELEETIGLTGPVEHRLRIATNIAFDSDGYLYVMDAGRFQIVKYDRDGHYRGYLGNPGDSPGFFGRPRGVAIDRENRIYAVDAAFDVVQVFNESGQVLTILGGSGSSPGTLTLPAGIWIDYDNISLFEEFIAPGFEVEYLIFVTSQFHRTNGISVYGFGKMTEKKYKSDIELKSEVMDELMRKRDAEN